MQKSNTPSRKTPRMDRSARMILQAIFQIELEGVNNEGEVFKKKLKEAIEKRIKGVRKSQLRELVGYLALNTDPKDKGKVFRF